MGLQKTKGHGANAQGLAYHDAHYKQQLPHFWRERQVFKGMCLRSSL